MNKEQIVVTLERLRERKIDIEDAIFEIEEYIDEDNSIVEELEALEIDDENFEMKVKGLISLVEDYDNTFTYKKARYKDVKKLVRNSSLEELYRMIRDIRDK